MLECRLLQFKTVHVGLRSCGIQTFEVLRYEADKYVVRGAEEVAQEEKVTMKVDPFGVVLNTYGTPVVCHGLKNKATYLNGKIGDVRSFDHNLKTSHSSPRV
jgi:hypothetical protein